MEDDLIDEKLSGIILRALRLKAFPLRKGTRSFEVPGWDSLSHVAVIMAVEDAYDLEFKTGDIVALQSVGDLEQLVKRYGH
ncbi:MAG: acyl carrier protein [Gemmatimonadaceae bacterium]